MTTVELLREARALYEAAPSHSSHYPKAGTVCLVTACCDAARPAFASADLALAALRRVTGAEQLCQWNVTATTDEALAAFDRAIESVS